MTATNNSPKTVAQVLKAFEKAENAATKTRDDAVKVAEAEFAKALSSAETDRNVLLARFAKDHFKAGKTLEAFAKLYGKSVPTTRNHLKELGVEVPVGKRGVKSKYTEAQQEAIAKAWKNGTTRDRLKLALDKGVTEATMRNWAIEHGVYEPKKRETEAQVEAPVTETEVEVPVEAEVEVQELVEA